MRNCSHCGRSVPPGKPFCPYCGQRLTDQSAVPGTSTYTGTGPVGGGTEPVPKKTRKPIPVGLIAMGAVGIVALILFFLLGGRDMVRGLPLWPMVALCGVFALFFAVDLLGHKFLHVARNMAHWLVLACVTAGLVLTGAGAAFSQDDGGEGRTNLDFAYRYLLDGHGDAATEKAQLCPQEDREIIMLLADAVERDYLSVYFQADKVLKEGGLNAAAETRIREMRSLAAGALGISISTEGELTSGADSLPLVGVSEETVTESITETERKDRMDQLVREVCDVQGAGQVMDDKTADLYEMDKAMVLDDVSGLSGATVEQMLAQYPNDTDVLLVAVKYYVRVPDYTRARQIAQQLLSCDGSADNLVIYTDIIAQQVKDGQSSLDPTLDSEARDLLSQAEQKEQQASTLNTQLPSEQEQYDQLMNEAEDLRQQAANLDITRAMNYLLAKKPLMGDSSGLLDLQIAKLYLAAGDREKAKEYIWQVVDNCGVLEEDSPIREPLEEVVEAYNRTEAGEPDPALTAAVQRLMRAQSQNVVSTTDGSINDTMAGFVASTLKYDRLSVLIGKIDTENYPTVRAYVNVSGEKDNTYGAASDFEAGDFELFDTQYQISDFQLVKEEGADQVSIALVMDHSGSMAGAPLADAKVAAEACANNMDPETQRMALIPYDDTSSVSVPLTNSAATLISGIRELSDAGGTYISGALRTALTELDTAGGTRAIILLTDGQDGGSEEEMMEVLELAKEKGIAIFTIGLGEVNEAYLRTIANTTGGKFIVAESSTELADIYLLLQRYIVNNYCFEYTVTENPDTDPRSLTVGIPAYGEDDMKAYRISGEEVTDAERDTGIYPVTEDDLAVYALTPGSVAEGDLSRGITVTVRGSGFKDGMSVSVGNVALTDISVKDAGELTGKLQGNLTAGSYTVQVKLPDGRVDALYDGFWVFRAGTVSSVQMGNVFIMADNIGVTTDSETYTTLIASGNVNINGFLYSTSQLTITPFEAVSEEALENAGQEALYLGTGGSVEGDGKLYVSYAQAKETAQSGNAFENMVGNTFAENIFNGKDLIVRNGTFSMDVGESDTDFGTGGYGQALEDELRDYSVKLPGFTEIGAAKVTLYADRLQLDAEALDFGDIEDNLVSALTGGVKGTKKDREALVKTMGGDWSRFFPLSGSLSIALGATDVRFGGEVSLDLPESKKFFLFPVKKLEIKINSLDPEYEYWSFTVGIQMPGTKKGEDGNGLDVAVASYFWYPDSLEVAVSLDPGIPIFKVFNLTKVGGGFSGASGLFINDETVTPKDVVLKILAEADVNVFKMLGWSQTGAARSITRWGELGKISDAQVLLNFSDVSLDISADLELLQQKIASAELGISTKSFLVKAAVGTELSAAGIDVGGELALEVKSCWAGQNQDGVSGSIGLEGTGHLRCSWADINWDNQKVGLLLSADIGTSSGTIIAAKVYCNDDWARAWYDSNGLMLWDKFHFESTF